MSTLFWKNRTVFITGASGFIGSWLTKALVDRGAYVTVLLYLLETESELIHSGYIERVHVVRGELQDTPLLTEILSEKKIDTLFHLAAQTQVKTAFVDPWHTYDVNVRGTWSLLEACRCCSNPPQRIIVASSDKAYGASYTLPYQERMELKAIYPYDVSKRCAEAISLSYHHTYGLPIAITRFSNVYGGGDFHEDRLIPYVIQNFYNEKSIFIRSDGKSSRDYVFIQDAVQGYLQLAEYIETRSLYGQVFNFGTGEPVSVLAIVQMLQQLMKKENIEIIIQNTAKGEIDRQYVDSTKAFKELDWKPQFPLTFGLQLTIDWYESLFKIKKNSLTACIV